MSRLRAKIDKEIENKDIKKKLRNVQARVHSNLLYNPNNQTNAERSGNLTAKGSARRAVAGGANRLNNNSTLIHSDRRSSPSSPTNRLILEPSGHRQMPYDETTTYIRSVPILQQHKQQPLSMYMTSSFNQKPRLIQNRQKKTKTKTSILPAISDNEPLEEIDKSSRSAKSVQELYTPRNGDSLSSSSSLVQSPPSSSRIPVKTILHSKTTNSTDQTSSRSRNCLVPLAIQSPTQIDLVSLSSGSTTYLNLDLDLCSLSSPKSTDDIFHMAPLIPAPSATTDNNRAQPDSSATLIRKFRNVLAREERSMAEDDINVVKNVLKTDERVNLLKAQEPDTNLFKDILKTQLDEIVKNEKVVKNALRILGASSSNTIEMSTPIEVYNVTPIQRPKSPDNRKCFSSRGKTKGGGKLNQYSTDSSPHVQSSYECEDYPSRSGRRRNVATDTFSIKDYTPRNEILDAYAEKRPTRKEKFTKIIDSTAQEEFEAFVKSTLPFKRKSVSLNRTVSHVVHRQQTLHDDLSVEMVKDTSHTHAEFSNSKDIRRPQVDVTFKNVPSVEKEILILKALGKRLEDTLKRSVSEPSLSENGDKDDKDDLQACSSASSLTRELQRIDPSIEVFPGRRSDQKTLVKNLRVIMNVEYCSLTCVSFVIFSKGLRFEIGIVNEFVIVSKTVNELLSATGSEFFIANENKPGGLEPIPFQKIAEQPQVLMRYLKPKNPSTNFNLLDQDTIFFNSFLLPGLKQQKVPEKHETISIPLNEIPLKEDSQPKICEGGDSLLVAAGGLRSLENEPNCSKYCLEKSEPSQTSRRTPTKKASTKPKPIITELPVSATASQRAVHRGRIRRMVTPMPADTFDDPKNNLVKTILVGAVQVSIFLVMIMAITYPDVKC